MNSTDRLAEVQARAEADSALLKAASSNSDDWDDATWAAWFRAAERAHDARKDRVAQLEAENDELRAKLTVAERQLQRLDGELVRLREANTNLRRHINYGAA